MYRGWRVVGGSFVCQAFVNGFFTYAISMLTGPVQESFEVGIEQVMYGLSLGNLLGLVTMPLAGALLDRRSVRAVMAFGLLFFALSISAAAYSQDILQYTLAIGLSMAVVTAFAGPMTASILASRWFTVSRGKAMGISAVGTSAGGVLVPMLIAMWLPEYGWRGALLNLAVVLVVFVLPLIWFTVRGWPRELGLEPEAMSGVESVDVVHGLLGVRQILSMREFWAISLAFGLMFCSYVAILANLTPYVTGLGHTAERASALIMVVAVSSIFGKLSFGIAADRFSRRAGLWTAQAMVISGALLLSTEPGMTLLVLACMLLGFAGGGILPVWGTLTAEVFGLTSYGQAMGLMGPVITLCVLPGFPLAGRLHDLTGSFSLGLMVFAAIVFAAALCLFLLRARPAVAKVQTA